jgi:peptidoglycan/LPS O-acetylase OafA/YrhL
MVMLYAHTEGPSLWMHVTQLPGTLDEFAAGIFLAKWVLDSRRRGPAPLGWLIGAAITGYATMAVYGARSAYWEFPLMVIFWRTALALFFLCVVAAAVDLPQAIARRWLRPLDYLGDISYGIYLWHLFAVQFIVYKLGMKHGIALVGALAMTILLAACSWHYFEKRIMSLARR